MSAAWIPLRTVEARPPHFPPGYLMAVFVGYGDESGKQDDPQSTCSAYGILVGANKHWDSFDEAWKKALCRADIDYFHRKEFGKPNGPYAQLDGAAELQLHKDLVNAVGDAGLELYGTAVRHPALKAFNEKTGLCLDAYALSLYGCLLYIWLDHQGEEVTLYLDWVEKSGHKLGCVENYIATNPIAPEFSHWFDGVAIHLAAKRSGGLARTPGYQAADFLAWEIRKYIYTAPSDEQRQAALDGLVRPMDWPPPRRRKSLHALNEARPIQGMFWDVEELENQHEQRAGVWNP